MLRVKYWQKLYKRFSRKFSRWHFSSYMYEKVHGPKIYSISQSLLQKPSADTRITTKKIFIKRKDRFSKLDARDLLRSTRTKEIVTKYYKPYLGFDKFKTLRRLLAMITNQYDRAFRKKRKAREILISHVLMGSILLKVKPGAMTVYVNMYYDLLQSYTNFEKNINKKYSLFRSNLGRWLGCKVDLVIVNNFIFYWEMQLFYRTNKLFKTNFDLQQQARTLMFTNAVLAYRRVRYKSLVRYFFGYFGRYQGQFGKNRYFHTTAPALLLLFVFPFDSQLLATIIAEELARLRGQHRMYVNYLQATLNYGFANYGYKFLDGIEVTLNGQLTAFNRRMTRTQVKKLRIGQVSRSHLGRAVSFAQEVSINRFGTIGVSVCCQYKHFSETSKKQSLNTWLKEGYFRDLVTADIDYAKKFPRFSQFLTDYTKQKESILGTQDIAILWSHCKYYNYESFYKYHLKFSKGNYLKRGFNRPKKPKEMVDLANDYEVIGNFSRFNRATSFFIKNSAKLDRFDLGLLQKHFFYHGLLISF